MIERRHLVSGRRRKAPKPVQGASIKILSNRFSAFAKPSCPSSRPSNETTSPIFMTWRTNSARASEISFAKKYPLLPESREVSKALLPPGPAHMSSQRKGLSFELLVAWNISVTNCDP